VAAWYVRNLKALAALRGETLTQVAAASGIPRRVLWSYTAGSRRPTPENRRRLAAHFGIPEAGLFGDVDDDDDRPAA